MSHICDCKPYSPCRQTVAFCSLMTKYLVMWGDAAATSQMDSDLWRGKGHEKQTNATRGKSDGKISIFHLGFNTPSASLPPPFIFLPYLPPSSLYPPPSPSLPPSDHQLHRKAFRWLKHNRLFFISFIIAIHEFSVSFLKCLRLGFSLSGHHLSSRIKAPYW